MPSDLAPFITVILPIKGRPALAHDALTSVLRQDMRDFEVIVSNNGAEAAVRDALGPLLGDPRVRYVEQSAVLDMPTHWEHLALLARGRYLTVLPDRSLFVRGALGRIRELHQGHAAAADILSWTWALYHDAPRLLQQLAGDGAVHSLQSDDVMLDSVSGGGNWPFALPRGLNASVSAELVREIRHREGAAFLRINPDFTFAYHCLVRRPVFAHLAAPLMVSQGLSVSNGGNSVAKDARAYLAAIGLPEGPTRTPARGATVENVIVEDFLAVCEGFGRDDLLQRWDRAAYYLRCRAEIDIKRAGGVADTAYVEWLSDELDRALAIESPDVRAAVAERSRTTSMLRQRMTLLARKLAGDRLVAAVRPFRLRLAGARRYSSALAAAGFNSEP